ncbi:AI-2E family transporter [Gimesia sp.]|uniref:AI-2E family transporter n=1 Tax=Gimesia sp. TaxID=2024833 RepID=UPI003A91FBC3
MQSDQPGVRDQKVVRLKEHTQTGSSSKLAHAIIALVFVVIFAAVLVLAWEILLALFMAVLFGVFLTHTSHQLSAWTPLPYKASLAAVVLILIGTFLGTTTFFFVQINQQIEEVHQQIDEGIERIHDWADKYISIGSVIRSTPFLAKMISTQNENRKQKKAEQDQPAEKNQSGSKPESETKEQPSQNSFQSLTQPAQQAMSFVGSIFKSTFGVVVNVILILFVGLFLAVTPQTYRDGVVILFPPERRDRIQGLMSQLSDTLWRWLLGRFGSMVITGLGAWLVLSLIGVPMAGTLGVISGLLTFIPNIGSLIAFCLAILIALPKGPTTAALVVPAFIGLQLVESYLITPLIQEQQVSLPPALLISFQAIMGVLFGFLGAMVASPLLAAGKVVVQELYVKDYLEKQTTTASDAES